VHHHGCIREGTCLTYPIHPTSAIYSGSWDLAEIPSFGGTEEGAFVSCRASGVSRPLGLHRAVPLETTGGASDPRLYVPTLPSNPGYTLLSIIGPTNSYSRPCLFSCMTVMDGEAIYAIGSRALSFSDPYFHFACLSVRHSFCHSVVLSVRNFGAKYLGNEAR